MSADIQSISVQRTGRAAVISALFFFVGMVQSKSGYGSFPDALAPVLGFLVLASEAAAFVTLLVGVIRWPLRIIRSPRWLLSTLGMVFVAIPIVAFMLMAITVAIALP